MNACTMQPLQVRPDAAHSVPANILIVDDPKHLGMLEKVLDDPAYRLVRATSIGEAMLALMAEEFVVLVLDASLPGRIGFELAQVVRERQQRAQIPIIFLASDPTEVQQALEGYTSGAVDYLHKPVNPAVLRSKVAVFVELHRKGGMLDAANRRLLREVAERRNAEAKLLELNQTLDHWVRQRTAELQQSDAHLRDANERKDEFLATLAHELRNPLAPVRNAVALLKRQASQPGRAEWATTLIDRQVQALSRLIDDLMDVSRINRGRVELKRDLITLNEVLADAIESVRPQAEEMGQELVVSLPDRTLVVDGDRTRLAQAFVNLLHNAVKFTERQGRIGVGVRVERDAATVTISDTGVGIRPDHLERIFEMFSQVEPALARSRGGLGIGLSLTRQLVQMHGGSVRADSDGLGRGSRFQVQLPLVAAEVLPMPEVSVPQPASPERPLRVLVADDNVDAAETMGALLEISGHEVHLAHDGAAAVDGVLGFDPDVVLLDIGMPRMNGYEACRRIRQQAGGPQRTIVALTGWGQQQDLDRSKEAGFDRHLVKPVDPDALAAVLAEVRPCARGAETPGRSL